MSAGILIKEYASDPSTTDAQGVTRMNAGAPVLCEQHVACGPSPAESAPFSQQTRFIVMTLGTSEPHNDDRAVHVEIGLDPFPSLVARWRDGALARAAPADSLDLPCVRAVGPGARLAVLGLNLGSHGHPVSPTMSAGETP
jgi:hypothetical protein